MAITDDVGFAPTELQDLHVCESWLRRAIAGAERQDGQPGLAVHYNNLSQIFQARGDLDSAELWLRKAIAITESLRDRVKLRTLYGNAADLLRRRGRDAEASAFERKRRELEEPAPRPTEPD